MMTNSDVTIYNKKYNEQTRLDEWFGTVLRNVHVFVDHKVAVTEKGLKSADLYKIRVPEEVETPKIYIPSSEYMGKGGEGTYWTISKGDIIVMGDLSTTIEKPSDLSILGVDFCTVSSFSDNRHGMIPHWRIFGE